MLNRLIEAAGPVSIHNPGISDATWIAFLLGLVVGFGFTLWLHHK